MKRAECRSVPVFVAILVLGLAIGMPQAHAGEYDLSVVGTIPGHGADTALVWKDGTFWALDSQPTGEWATQFATDGTPLASFSVPVSANAAGLAWGQSAWWVANNTGDQILECDESFNIVNTYSASLSQLTGLVWGGGNLWACDNASDTIYQVTLSGGSASFTPWSSGNPDPVGLAWDGSSIWSISHPGGSGNADPDRRDIYRHGTGGAVLDTYHYPERYGQGITFMDGQLCYLEISGLEYASDAEIVLTDIGASDDSPEPATWLLLACTCGAGAVLRRRSE